MTTHSGLLRIHTDGHGEIVDLTEGVRSVLRTAEVDQGVVSVFVGASTAAVTTIEFDPSVIADLRSVLERLVPANADYEQTRRDHRTNAYARVRASILGPSITVPISAGLLGLGTWQQIVLVDFDDRPRERTVAVHVLS
ncbi:MAG TPA: secondary thiamine-phosphate synthase enzyme YjbQ [Solirubrobacteraceae bacterium]|jgi:secondary thiamine-phosphate synthase enzyme|nr:secondary thiamine-phosphate synthase enzyme YjbQ [Solirubrobacteraceae bacterium]